MREDSFNPYEIKSGANNSVGRVPSLQVGGRRFKSCLAHVYILESFVECVFFGKKTHVLKLAQGFMV